MIERNVLESPIEYLKGVGPHRADLLKSELQIMTFGDLLYEFPFRYIDRSTFQKVRDIRTEGQVVQLKGKQRKRGGRGNRHIFLPILPLSLGDIA